MKLTVTVDDLKALAGSEIIKARGFSGLATDIETAMAAPALVVVEASNGKSYDLAKVDGDTYELLERN